jgi:hypothetical protein
METEIRGLGNIRRFAFLADHPNYLVQHTTEMSADTNFAYVILFIIKAICVDGEK